jgi:hypothetical protein
VHERLTGALLQNAHDVDAIVEGIIVEDVIAGRWC